MWRILQQDAPSDYVLATGVTTSVRNFVHKAFGELGITIEFKGEGRDEVGIVTACTNDEFQIEKGTEVLVIDPRYFRPTEVELLIGDATRAHEKLGWTPKSDLDALVEDMMKSEIALMKKEKYLKEGGHKILNRFE
ncbi:MAG: GDP-mannose 4,6-dehydratase [Deltaproteobacteria bacterium]|nr:GDP-mannose 4,6-dehydratase [Deltaproteobacteria bacterium]